MAFHRIKPVVYHQTTKKINMFYEMEGLIKTYQQNSLNVLSACEDSENIVSFKLENSKECGLHKRFACIQTGQMGLECEILETKEILDCLDNYLTSSYSKSKNEQYQCDQYKLQMKRIARTHKNPLAHTLYENMHSDNSKLLTPYIPRGYYCESTSTRDEKKAGDGRRYNTFAMSEFEMFGSYDHLRSFLHKFMAHIGFENVKYIDYEEACDYLNVSLIEDQEEKKLCEDIAPVVLLGKFPKRTDPYWNMKHSGEKDIYNKIDVLIHGVETIGSAERSCDVEQMKQDFYNQDQGKYCDRMFKMFGRERVETELDIFLSHEFVPRYGGGVGLQRLIEGMKKEGIDTEKYIQPEQFQEHMRHITV